MRHSKNYSLRLPERVTERNDPADIDDLTFDMESIDSVLKVQDNEDKRLERDKLDKADHNRHKTAVPIDHPDGSVTDAKLGNRTVLTTTGTLQTLLTAIGNAIKAIVGAATWSSAPPITLTDTKAHTVSVANPHKVTKAQVGLGSADNTSDVNKPVSTAQQTALNGKVDKITGKGLSTEDYTSAEKDAVAANSAARHTHGNKSVLDGITAALVVNWNAAFSHIADAVKHITAAERTRWNAVTTKLGLTGGTLTGFLTLHANPTSNLHAATKQYVDNSVSDLGGGDMLKAVYDTTNNGVVDKAESVAWGGVTGKPASFAPAAHGHATADVTGLDAKLSTKANNTLGMAGTDLLAWAANQTISGGFAVSPDGTPINNPAPGQWLWGSLEKPAPNRTIIRLTSGSLGTEYKNYVDNDVWKGWQINAIATQPQEFDLPLAAGISTGAGYRSKYYKNQFGEVTIFISATGNIVDNALIATLPGGFTPKKTKLIQCISIEDRAAGFLRLELNGDIRASFGVTKASVCASDTFLTVQ